MEEARIVDRKMLLSLSGILAVFVAILWTMGRIPYCECGIGLWTWESWSSATSQHFGDPYSFSHFLHGLGFFYVLWLFRKKISLRYRFLIAIFLEIGWEILENTPFIINRYRAATASLDYVGDSILNSLGDVAFTIFGFWVARKLPWWGTLGVFIIIEIIMLFTIRDNLTLNILMLVYPIETIREWQIH